MPASHWEKLCATFTTAYVINGSMDNSPDIFECEHGCGMFLFLSLSLSLTTILTHKQQQVSREKTLKSWRHTKKYAAQTFHQIEF